MVEGGRANIETNAPFPLSINIATAKDMRPSEWARNKIESLSLHHRVIWVEDPYRLVDDQDVALLNARLSRQGFSLIAVANAFDLRLQLEAYSPDTAKLVVLDQSCIPREPHLLPRDCKPSDFRPLPAPDWRAAIHPEARFRPTVRTFLTEVSGDSNWPVEVDIYPYEMLAREDPEGFLRAYESVRRTRRSVTSEDLLLVGASAVFGMDLFDIGDPLAALRLAFHSKDKWDNLSEYFNGREVGAIRGRLCDLPAPLSNLFGPKRDDARLALSALLVLRQHFEEPGILLPLLSPALAPYQEFNVRLCTEPPSWFLEHEVPCFEKLLNQTIRKTLHERLGLADKEKAREFALRERMSSNLRELAPFEIEVSVGPERPGSQPFDLGRLVPEFSATWRKMRDITNAVASEVERLRLARQSDMPFSRIWGVFVGRGAYQLEELLGQLDSLVRNIEGPARRRWDEVPGFADRWKKESAACRDAMASARALLDDLDYHFGKLLETRYSEMVQSEVLSIDAFYRNFIGPRRRADDGSVRKAVVLVFDSLRFDFWRTMVRPLLEKEYVLEESFGFARLPSETRFSRRAFFAGQPPKGFRAGDAETQIFARTVEAFHQRPVEFEARNDLRPGQAFAVRSRDGLTHATVFDFADRLSHEVDWDYRTLHKALSPLLEQVQAVLEEAGRETLVFATSDHGHIRQRGGTPVYIESEDVGYRSAFVRERVAGADAAHVYQMQADALGHAGGGWYVFPKPAFYLRPAGRRSGRPGASHRHGGLSLFEVVVPLAFLRHREAPVKMKLIAGTRGKAVVGQSSEIQVTVSADGVLTSPVRVVADSDEVLAATVMDITSVPKAVPLQFIPSSPGPRKIGLAAYLGEQEVGATSIEITVSPAPEPEDAAKVKLRKLFGEI